MAAPKKKTDGEGGDTSAEQVENTDAETTTVDPRVAELEQQLATANAERESLAAQLSTVTQERDAAHATVDTLTAQVTSLRDELTAAGDRRIHDLAEMRARFDQAWQDRMGTPTPMPSPVRGPVRRFAASLIRCHDTTGAKLTLSAGDPIPDEADLTGVSRDAIEER
jgi:septal ring factor EnvC (AmiA/AmiB activator)